MYNKWLTFCWLSMKASRYLTTLFLKSITRYFSNLAISFRMVLDIFSNSSWPFSTFSSHWKQQPCTTWSTILLKLMVKSLKTRKTASVLNWIETNKVKKERYLMRRGNTIYTFSMKLSLSSKGQNKSKLQKQTSNILISTIMAAWYNERNGCFMVKRFVWFKNMEGRKCFI